MVVKMVVDRESMVDSSTSATAIRSPNVNVSTPKMTIATDQVSKYQQA